MGYGQMQGGPLAWILIATIWFFFLLLMLAPALGYSLENAKKFFFVAIALWVSALFFDMLPAAFPNYAEVGQVSTVVKSGAFCTGLVLFARGLFDIKKS